MSERLTDDFLRGYASADYGITTAQIMAAELLALRARVAKLETELALERAKYAEWRSLAERYERERRMQTPDAEKREKQNV